MKEELSSALAETKAPSAMFDIWSDPDGGKGHQDGVERRAGLSYDDFVRDYTRGNRPVLITDIAKNWGAMKKWTPEYFRDRYGALEIKVRVDRTDKGEHVPLGEFMNEVLASRPDKPGRYAYQISIEDLPGLADDILPHPEYWRPNWLEDPNMLRVVRDHALTKVSGIEINIGGAGSAFPEIHYDEFNTETFIVQICGRKEWVLYSPDQTPYMYKRGPASTFSDVDFVGGVDLKRFPLFRNVRPTRFVIEPGEMFYNPPRWWHTTRALTPSIAVVYTIARGPIWWGVTKAASEHTLHLDWRSRPITYAKVAVIFAYMTAFRVIRSAADAFGKR
jgi:Cupin-like domain